jgi:hypothetical protein
VPLLIVAASDAGVLITGCQSHETSADYTPTGDPADAYGALTTSLITAIRAFKAQDPYAMISHRCGSILHILLALDWTPCTHIMPTSLGGPSTLCFWLMSDAFMHWHPLVHPVTNAVLTLLAFLLSEAHRPVTVITHCDRSALQKSAWRLIHTRRGSSCNCIKIVKLASQRPGAHGKEYS